MPENNISADTISPAGREELSEWVSQRSGPFRVQFRRGEAMAGEDISEVRTDRGGDIAELHYPDGRYTTVRVGRDIVELSNGVL